MKKLNLQLMILAGAILLVSAACSDNDPVVPSTEPLLVGQSGDGLLEANLEQIVKTHNLPAINAMIVESGTLLESGSYGLRSVGSDEPVSSNDKWHLGSITKSMTATLTAILIEEGHLTWETSIDDLIDEGYRPEFADVTIYELLSHTGGISDEELSPDPADNRPLSEIRQEWAIGALNLNPGNRGQSVYANNNYIIAGAMLEFIMEKSWEDLMVEYLFQPLGMNDTGFGVPGIAGMFDQPWGHTGRSNNWETRDPGDISSENPLALGPAGTVHSTTSDLVKYVGLHQGLTNLLSSESLDMLHSEVNNTAYALGWNVSPSAIFHSGSNGRWFAQLVITSNNLALFAVTNSSDGINGNSAKAVQETLSLMGQRYENSQR